MKKIITLIAIGLSLNTLAQHLQQVLILNEGYFDYTNNVSVEPVKIGSYDVNNNTYNTVNTLSEARFASDMIIGDGYYYVAADSVIYKFDLNTHQEEARVTCTGVRNLALYNDKLIVSRGDYDNTTFMPIFFESYLKVYNSSDLTLHADFDTTNGPQYASQNILIPEFSSSFNKAFILINNAYEWGNEKGLVGILDLNSMTYEGEIDLGSNGINPDNIMYHNGFIYTVNNKDWTGASVSKIDVNAMTLSSTSNISTASTGCGTSCLKQGNIVYQISQDSNLIEYDVVNMSNIGPISNYNTNFYALAVDPTSGNLFASNTDFFSYGKIYVYDEYDNDLYNFNAGITPGKIVFDVRFNTGIEEIGNSIFIYPNPSSDKLYFDEKLEGTIDVYNIIGETLISKQINNNQNFINISDLKNGKYILQYRNSVNKAITKSFVKI
jgi:hypothetical protein